MKEFFETYIQHQEDIEYFLQESLKNSGNLSNHKKNNFKQLYTIFPSLELVYIVNKDTKTQISENFYRYKTDENARNKDRSHLISKLYFKESNIAFSKPYISSATRSNCVTVTIKEGEDIFFLDFQVDILLQKLNLIELNKPFHSITKSFYILAGISMIILSVFTILFSIYDFITYLFSNHALSLEMIFKPIIAPIANTPNFKMACPSTSVLKFTKPSLNWFMVPITVSYDPIKSKMKAPEIPGKIMAIIAINPDKNKYQ